MAEPTDVERAKNWPRLHELAEQGSALNGLPWQTTSELRALFAELDRLTRKLREAEAEIARLSHALEQEQRTRAQAPLARRTDA